MYRFEASNFKINSLEADVQPILLSCVYYIDLSATVTIKRLIVKLFLPDLDYIIYRYFSALVQWKVAVV